MGDAGNSMVDSELEIHGIPNNEFVYLFDNISYQST